MFVFGGGAGRVFGEGGAGAEWGLRGVGGGGARGGEETRVGGARKREASSNQ